MDFSARSRNPLQRFGGLGAVALLHLLAVYALITGLAHRMIDAIKHPMDVRIVEEIKPPPPETPPPPAPKFSMPPPPFIPAPEVPVTQQPDINPIASSSRSAPQDHSFQKQPEIAAPPDPPAAPLPQKGRAHADWDRCMPHYPFVSLRFEEEGTTRIRFDVGADAKLKDAVLVRSSGFPRLDQSAMKALSDCSFQPAVKDGQPIESTLTVDFVWNLNGGGWH